jgi:hypothetical protein
MLSKMSEPGFHDPTERMHVRFSDDADHSDLTNVHSVRDIAGILAAQGDVSIICTSRARDVAALFKLMRDIGPYTPVSVFADGTTGTFIQTFDTLLSLYTVRERGFTPILIWELLACGVAWHHIQVCRGTTALGHGPSRVQLLMLASKRRCACQ